MTFKLLFTADIHFSNNLPFAKPTQNGLTDRFEDQLKVWEQIDEIAREHEVKAKFILGDVFDQPRADAVTLTHTVEKLLEETETPLYILPGNHDANNIRGGRFIVEAFKHMQNNIVVMDSRKPVVIFQNWRFWFVEYMTIEETKKEIKKIRKKMSDEFRNVLLLHNSVVGAHSYGWECDEGLSPKFVCKGFDCVIAGHFHEYQGFGKNGIYLGSPMQHHFGDAGNRSLCWIVEFKEDGAEFSPVDINAPKFYAIKDDDFAQTYRPNKGDYVRYDIEASHEKWTQIKQRIMKKCDNLNKKGINASFRHIPIHKRRSRIEIDTEVGNLSLENAIKEYVKMSATKYEGLDKKRLRLLGKEALKSVRDAAL